jgi:2-polyprenyl-3-methyl-5-hydroxy-6-metoxy-1,4-benzoquinol methylase
MSLLEKKLIYYSGDRIDMLAYISKDANRILEIGCGQGNFAAQLLKPTREVWGIEPNVEAAKIASTKLYKVLSQKVEDCIHEIPDNYFDAIIFNDVLEHLLDPWHILKIIRVKLSQEGKVIASIPNFRYITNLFNILIKKDWVYEDAGILDATHIRFFTKKSINKLFLQNNYQILKMEGICRTTSFKGLMLASLINLFSLGYHHDIFFKQYVVIAKKANQ